MKKRNLTCIVCPNGCEITAYIDQSNSLVIENTDCKRGLKWAKQELTNPTRTIASSILVKNGDLPLVSVKTDKPIPLCKISEVITEIKSKVIDAPVRIGQIIITNVGNTTASIIATKEIKKAPKSNTQKDGKTKETKEKSK